MVIAIPILLTYIVCMFLKVPWKRKLIATGVVILIFALPVFGEWTNAQQENLLSATEAGDFKGVKSAVFWGAGADRFADKHPYSPLRIAVSDKHYDIAIFLMDHGANPKHGDESGLADQVKDVPKWFREKMRSYER
jgi:energy-coupling factor transporter transmembrane protein EcfT